MTESVVINQDNYTHTLSFLLNTLDPGRLAKSLPEDWMAPPERNRQNNYNNITVRFCDLQSDVLAVPYVFIGWQVRRRRRVRLFREQVRGTGTSARR